MKDAAENDLQNREEPNGNRIVTTATSTGRKMEYYDRNGKLTSTITTNDSEDERDQYGNWTRKTQYIAQPGSEPRINSITTRRISCY